VRILTGSSLLRKISGAFSVNIIGLFISYLLQIVLARNLGISEYGEYVYAISLAIVISNFAGLGLPITNLRFIPSYIALNQWSLVRGLIERSLTVTSISGLLASLCGVSLVLYLDNIKFNTASLHVIIALLIVPLLCYVLLQNEILKAFNKIIYSIVPYQLVHPILVGGTIFVISFSDISITSFLCLSVFLLCMLCVFLIQDFLINVFLPSPIKAVPPQFASLEWAKASVSFLFLRSTGVIIRQQMDILMIRAFVGPEEVAIYNVAFKLATLVSLILVAANSVSAPLFSSLYAEGKLRELQDLVSKEVRYVFWGGAVISVALIASSSLLIEVFGANFSDARWPMFILIFGQLVSSGAGSVAFLLNMTGFQNTTAKVFGFSAVINISLSLFLIPNYGSIGAAIGTSLTTILWNVILVFTVVKHLDINPTIIGSYKNIKDA
jgi:O-antigen/teichoic acid export membrane protein